MVVNTDTFIRTNGKAGELADVALSYGASAEPDRVVHPEPLITELAHFLREAITIAPLVGWP